MSSPVKPFEVEYECPWKLEDIPAPVVIKEEQECQDPLEPADDTELEVDPISPTSLVKEEMEVEDEEVDDDNVVADINHVDVSTVSHPAANPSAHSKKAHKCNVCQERFGGSTSLLTHKIRVHNHPKLLCELCPPPGKSYLNKRSLKSHQLSCHPDEIQYIPKKPSISALKKKSSANTDLKVLPCELCGEVFENYSKLLLHTRREHPRKSIKCSLCPNTEEATTLLWLLDELPRHLDEVHGLSEFKLTCDVPTCGKIFYVKKRLQEHNDRHHKTSHTCKECNKVFPTFSKFRSHNVTVHRQTKGLKCTLCSERFSGGKALLSHKIRVHNHPKLECGSCPKTFMGRLARKEHWLRYHPEEEKAETFQQNVRTKYCQKDGDKKKAGVVAIPKDQKSFSCDQCGAVMKSKLTLQMHLKNVHATTKDFCCELCGFRTKTNEYLKDHMRRHNAQEQCPQCPRKLQNKSKLRVHLRSHSEEKRFSCEVCGEAFRRMRMLKLHSLKHEMEEKAKNGKPLDPCECPECGKVLSRPDKVKIHMIAHSEERKFKCDECGKKFKMNADLKKHMRRAHGGDNKT